MASKRWYVNGMLFLGPAALVILGGFVFASPSARAVSFIFDNATTTSYVTQASSSFDALFLGQPLESYSGTTTYQYPVHLGVAESGFDTWDIPNLVQCDDKYGSTGCVLFGGEMKYTDMFPSPVEAGDDFEGLFQSTQSLSWDSSKWYFLYSGYNSGVTSILAYQGWQGDGGGNCGSYVPGPICPDPAGSGSRIYFQAYEGNTVPLYYYAQAENTSTVDLYAASSTSASVLKTFPADWIVQVVSSTNSSGSPMVNGSDTWFRVGDPTDGASGWMIASDTAGQYISSYDGSAQSAFEASSSDQIATDTTEDADIVMGAIDHYYNDASTNNSLYSSDDASGINAATGATSSNYLSIFKERGYPENFILGIAAHEDGLDPYYFDNEVMSYDYGGGIMQVTFKAYSTEPTSTGNPWNFINNTWDNRGIGSGVTIPPCASYETSTYANCYAHAGVQNGYSKSYQPYGGTPGAPEYKQYSNTIQSIYANVKDGMKALEGAYFGSDYWNTTSTENNEVCNYTSSSVTIYPPDVPATTTYSCLDREIILTTADYNGGEYGAISDGTTTNYLYDVASDTINISRFFSTSTDATTTAIADKMILANNSNVYMQLHSPGDLSIQDTHGHMVGVVNGVATNTFPFASYDPVTKTARIFFPQDDNLTYKVTGTGTGVYGLDIAITSGTQQIAFHRDESAPIVPGEVDTYTINASTVLNHGNGVTLNVDKKGNGTVNEVQKFGANIVTLPLEVGRNTPYQELPKPKKSQVPAVESRPIVITPQFQVPTTTLPVNFSTTIPMVIVSSTIATSTE